MANTGIELVVGLREQSAIGARKDAHDIRLDPIQRSLVFCVENDCEREVSQGLAVSKDTEAIAEILDVSLF